MCRTFINVNKKMRCIFILNINKFLQICIYDITLINKHDLNPQTEIIIEGCENVVKLIVIFVCLQKNYTSGVLDFESLKYYD